MEKGLTGIKEFDDIVGEVLPKELVVIASRPGMGKHILARQIFSRFCDKKKIAYVSDMDGIDCVIECVSKGEKEKEQWFLKEKLNKTAHFYTLEVELIFLSITLATIKKETGLDFIFIDDFERFIPQVSSELKVKILRGLAEELDVAIFVLAKVIDESDEPRINCNTVNGDLFAAADKVFGVCRKDFYATIDEIAENKIVQGESLLCVVKNDKGKRIAVTVYINYLSKEFQELPF